MRAELTVRDALMRWLLAELAADGMSSDEPEHQATAIVVRQLVVGLDAEVVMASDSLIQWRAWRMMKLLAAPYRDRPGFRPEWTFCPPLDPLTCHPAWGHGVAQPSCAHLRATMDGWPTGTAICGALLIGEVADPATAPGAHACRVCLDEAQPRDNC